MLNILTVVLKTKKGACPLEIPNGQALCVQLQEDRFGYSAPRFHRMKETAFFFTCTSLFALYTSMSLLTS